MMCMLTCFPLGGLASIHRMDFLGAKAYFATIIVRTHEAAVGGGSYIGGNYYC